MYELLLTLHSWVRWLVLLTGLWALANAFTGVRAHGPLISRAPFTAFMGSVHLQLLLGLALFAIMGMSGAAPFSEPAAPRSSFGWEHLGLGLLTAVFATMANATTKRAAVPLAETAVQGGQVVSPNSNEQQLWRSALLWTVLAWIPLLLLIPWWRPALRMFGA